MMTHGSLSLPSPSSRRLLALAIVAGAVGGAVGCAAPRSGPIAVFPPPPDVARFQYLRSFSDEEDLKTSGWDRFVRVLIPRASWTTLNAPFGLALSPDDKTLYVAASATARVIAVDLEKGDFTAFGMSGDNETKVVRPLGVAVDATGAIYVADRTLNAIKIYGPDLKYRGKIADGRLVAPSSIAIDRKAQLLFVVNDPERRGGSQSVEIYTLSGQHLRTIGGGIGTEEGKFILPSGVAVSGKGEIYVSDKLNFRVQVFDREGKFIRKFGEAGTGQNFPGQFDKIHGIAFDSFDNIYIADAMQGVQILNPDAQPLYAFNAGFQLPLFIAISSTNRIYVGDAGAHAVHEFQLINTAAEDSFKKPVGEQKDAPREAPKGDGSAKDAKPAAAP